jgi:hypothetical protein
MFTNPETQQNEYSQDGQPYLLQSQAKDEEHKVFGKVQHSPIAPITNFQQQFQEQKSQRGNRAKSPNTSNIELVAYSEQIIGDDQEIATNIPTQDQALKQSFKYPDTMFV